MSKTRKPGSVMPLHGGDYIDEGDGPKPFKPPRAKPDEGDETKAAPRPAKPAKTTH